MTKISVYSWFNEIFQRVEFNISIGDNEEFDISEYVEKNEVGKWVPKVNCEYSGIVILEPSLEPKIVQDILFEDSQDEDFIFTWEDILDMYYEQED